ncbi:hypothetical protein NP493_624g00023 [Ridgeia piscesae]|uniref:Uncharacterized protein n=1 Tax=Ridgeia piscesae TaxID=27915 RepID=A0AAD9KTG2_RIDPI|nr:hypothetical protein NP493_624g00023 [Ridgeia piscesae]
MTPEDKQLVDRLVARMKFLQTQQAAKKSRPQQTEGNKGAVVGQQDIHQETSEGQFEDPINQQQTREVDLGWEDHVIDDAHLGVEPETPKCTDVNCLGDKAEALLELERKLLSAMNYAKLHGISVSQLLDLLQSA